MSSAVDEIIDGMEPPPVMPKRGNPVPPFAKQPAKVESDSTTGSAPAVVLKDAPPAFTLVPFDSIPEGQQEAAGYAWQGLVPRGFVTLFAGHGGAGKSTVALQLAVATAAGLPLFGIPTTQAAVVVFSGEDGAALIRHRLQVVCRCMGVNLDDLQDRLFVLDATEGDPVLFCEVNLGGRREGTTTAVYEQLREFVFERNAGLVLIDNASDVYDASEIDRARVRSFMRALTTIAKEANAGVVLLAHVDKGTSRGERTGTEGYSGSTAWNNSARSRLFLSRGTTGALVLAQQKHNLGPLHEPIELSWPTGGVPQADAPVGAVVQGIADRNYERALLKLISEFSVRGEHVSAAITAKTNAPALLGRESTYPKIKPGEVFDLLRQAERSGRLTRAEIRTENRKTKEVWQVTEAGRQFAGLPFAPSAVRAPTPHTPRAEDGAHGAPLAPAALAAPTMGDGAHGADGAPQSQ